MAPLAPQSSVNRNAVRSGKKQLRRDGSRKKILIRIESFQRLVISDIQKKHPRISKSCIYEILNEIKYPSYQRDIPFGVD